MIDLSVEEIRSDFGKGDAERDKGLTTPKDIKRYNDISYGSHGKWNLLDVYHVNDIRSAQPAIISIHGGAWVYGTKEVYQYYCMNLAERGFTVVNFNYRLAPESIFPSALYDINDVFAWVESNADKYHIDLNNIFVVGDSAGAQLASQYLAILSNKAYAKLFDFKVPDIKVNAASLNCGIYDAAGYAESFNDPVVTAYLGPHKDKQMKYIDTMKYITKDFPACFIMTAYYDFLKANAEPMYKYLKNLGIDAEYKMYGSKEKEYIGHVFHCNVKLDEANQCNDDECNFFKEHIIN